MSSVLQLRDVRRTYGKGVNALEVLRGVNLDLRAGEMVALLGPSGSGKSTLLHAAGLLDPPTSGEVIIDGKNSEKLNDTQRTRLRRNHIGFVYQFHHLLPEFSAEENIILPQILAGRDAATARKRARDLLREVDLLPRAMHRPAELSGGEAQRVAIARALANAPKLLLADEPTGNLDEATAENVFQMLVKLARAEGVAMLIVTHNQALAARMDRIVTMQGGQLH
ncbi:MAG TPA: ABC transporter ATP-binding protein [Alphaproteobacteria bacterium]|nr:ABC transporter [Rhodospirillaceae bacterium]HRJ13042.1 ABC transporter ATP-binding protein [Alphaproteobacteria bacterium]